VRPSFSALFLTLASSIAVAACQKRAPPDPQAAAIGLAIASLASTATNRYAGAAVGSRLVTTMPFEIDVKAHFSRDGTRVLIEHNKEGLREVRALGVGAWSFQRVSEVQVSDVGGAFAILAEGDDPRGPFLRTGSGERSLGSWPAAIHFLPGTPRLFVADRERACVDDHCESLRCEGVEPGARGVVRSLDGRLLVLTAGISTQKACMLVVAFSGETFSMRRIEGASDPRFVAGESDLTYLHHEPRGWFVVHGKDRWGPYDEPPSAVTLSPSGAHVGYEVRGSSSVVFYADGESVHKEPIGPSFEVCTPSIPAQCMPQAGGVLVSFAFQGETYTKGAIPSFSPRPQVIHGTRAATVFRSGKMAVRAGAAEWTGFEDVDARSLSFSEDGRRLRFGAILRPTNTQLEARWYEVDVP
jgi:hypothetical protein